MAVQHGVWEIGEYPQRLHSLQLESEVILENQIAKDISILNPNWLLIGRQVFTDFGKYIDLMAIDASGSIIIIELKKHKTSRDVVAQAIDYASWVESLSSEKFAQLYKAYAEYAFLPHRTLDDRNKLFMRNSEWHRMMKSLTAHTRW